MTSSYSADNISAHVQLRIGVAFKSCCLLSVLAVTICSDVAQYSHREVGCLLRYTRDKQINVFCCGQIAK
jgi:hypothetical protein